MRKIRLWCAAVLIASAAWSPAVAQTTNDGWDVFVAPYLMGPRGLLHLSPHRKAEQAWTAEP